MQVMDQRNFDHLARGFAAGIDRRKLLRGLAALVGLGVSAHLSEDVLAADGSKPRPVKQPKRLKPLVSCKAERPACGGVCCKGGETCAPDGSGCLPDHSIPCGDGYCVTGDQVCYQGTSCIPGDAIPCGSGYCAEEGFCRDGRCVGDDPCHGKADGTACGHHGRTCTSGICGCNSVDCPGGLNCGCVVDTDGSQTCGSGFGFASDSNGNISCASDSDCPVDNICSSSVFGDVTGLCGQIQTCPF